MESNKDETLREKNGGLTRSFDAAGYVKGLKMLDRMNEMLPIGRVKDTLEYSEEHPYWRGDKETRDRAFAIVEAQLRLLESVMPKKMPRARKEKGK